MLKLLLSHWQAHREPLPFVLTDDPLYCSHLTTSPFPEVYSVNRVNPIFEEDEAEENRKTASPGLLKRSLSEERRENETRASDDTGYSSSGQLKSLTSDVGSFGTRQMSSDSDESSPEAVIVSADVHRVSYPDDVIVLSSSNSSHTFSANSLSSHYGSDTSSQEPFDSLTMSSLTDVSVREERQKSSVQTEVKRPVADSNMAVREKLQKLLERGNERTAETFLDSLDAKQNSDDRDIERTRTDLMKSLNRALNNKVPKHETPASTSRRADETVTRTDSALEDKSDHSKSSHNRKSVSSFTSPKSRASQSSNGVTRQDESSASSLSSSAKQRKHQHRNNKSRTEKETKRETSVSTLESKESQHTQSSHTCKLCENAHRPLALHQLLPGHWSYDNVYLPQMSNVCYHCLHHHHNPLLPSSDDDMFYPLYYHHDIARARHSWAPYTTSKGQTENHQKNQPNRNISVSSKDLTASDHRTSPDGTSHETDSSQIDRKHLKHSLPERRSLRAPKKCKCDECLTAALDKDAAFLHHPCNCYCLPHRKVKFASDSDISQHHPPSVFRPVKDVNKLSNGNPINAAYVLSLPHLNGHIRNKSQVPKENGLKSKKAPPLIPRGLKEPIKMDELYRSYPINFRDWEDHYRRTFLRKRRKRALTMVAIAIGIVFVVGVAIALAFVFLRITRPA